MALIALFILALFQQIVSAAKEGRLFFGFFVVALFSRAIFAVLHYEFGVFVPDSGKDTIAFEAESIRLSAEFSLIQLLAFWEISTDNGTYPILLAIFYKIFMWKSGSVGLLINFLLYGYSVILMYRSHKLLARLNNFHKIVFLCVIFLYPMLFFYGFILLREMLLIYTCALSVYCVLLSWVEKRLPSSLFASLIVFNLVATVLHPGNSLFFLCVVACLLFATKSGSAGGWSKSILAAMAISAVIALATGADYYGGYLDPYVKSNYAVDKYLGKFDESNFVSAAAYEKQYTSDMGLNIFYALPYDLFNFTFQPLFYEFMAIRSSPYSYLSSLFFLSIFLGAVFSSKKNSRMVRIIIVIYFISVGMYALGSHNFVQAVRHKSKFFPLVVMLVPLILIRRQDLKEP